MNCRATVLTRNMWSRLYESGSQLEPDYISTALDVVVGKPDPLSLSIAATRAIAINLQRTRQPLHTRQRSLCYLFKSSVVPLSRRKRKDNRVSIYKEKESFVPIPTVQTVVAFLAIMPVCYITYLSLLPHSSILDPSIGSPTRQQFSALAWLECPPCPPL